MPLACLLAAGGITMAGNNTATAQQTGWCYSQAGTPIAYVMPLDDPADATLMPFATWWEALRFAVMFAHINGAEYVGGPE